MPSFKVVEQQRVGGFVIYDGEEGAANKAEVSVGGVGKVNHHAKVTAVFAVVERFDGKALFCFTGGEGERAAGGQVVAVGNGVAFGGAVIYGDGFGAGGGEAGGNNGRFALTHRETRRRKRHF